MKKFRIPRKTKKFLKKGLWLYPADENGNSLMGFPARDDEDFYAYKQGILKNLFDSKNSKQESKEYRQKMNKVVSVPNETLRAYVDEIFRKELRNSSYYILIKAQNHTRAVIAYYNFINAYILDQNGEDSYGNIFCLAVDRAKELLKKKH
jgi:hypothetical protein